MLDKEQGLLSTNSKEPRQKFASSTFTSNTPTTSRKVRTSVLDNGMIDLLD